MVPLACCYVAAIAGVQLMRFLKRLYVRKFANNVNRRMKRRLYQNLLVTSEEALEEEGAGSLMTKALSDVADCARSRILNQVNAGVLTRMAEMYLLLGGESNGISA
jgi:ABC-type multidrug transport system fused ATPase/permease subunit